MEQRRFGDVSKRMANLLRHDQKRVSIHGMDTEGYMEMAEIIKYTWASADEIVFVAKNSRRANGELRYRLRQYQGDPRLYVGAVHKVAIDFDE